MRTPWQHFRAFLARRIRYKITRGGALFTLAILLVAFGAIVSANNLLFLIVAAMMATLLISGLVSRLCLAGLALDFQVPEHIPAGRSVPARLFVRNHKWFLPSFSIRVEAIRDEGSPTMKSGVYFPLIAGRDHAGGGGGRPLSTPRRIPAERLRLLHDLPLRLPGENRARHPDPRNGGLPRGRSAARI